MKAKEIISKMEKLAEVFESRFEVAVRKMADEYGRVKRAFLSGRMTESEHEKFMVWMTGCSNILVRSAKLVESGFEPEWLARNIGRVNSLYAMGGMPIKERARACHGKLLNKTQNRKLSKCVVVSDIVVACVPLLLLDNRCEFFDRMSDGDVDETIRLYGDDIVERIKTKQTGSFRSSGQAANLVVGHEELEGRVVLCARSIGKKTKAIHVIEDPMEVKAAYERLKAAKVF